VQTKEEKIMIGLEIHASLATATKLFCSCSTEEAEPNSSCCQICLGHPGSKPVLNQKAIEFASKIALALNCKINESFFFSRKTYFYPDMSKNFQITQYEIPLAEQGFVELAGGKKVRIRRVHMEEYPAALIHPNGMGKSNYVLIDYNRSGLPLVEIVTEPDIESPKEARDFLDKLENILKYLGVLKGENPLKVDCNLSLSGGARVEIKNVSGFAAVEKALNFEMARQKQELKMGKKVEQHTRAFDAETGLTVALRKKETEEDYGYIFEPDLVKVVLSQKEISEIQKTMPELPDSKAKRFMEKYSLAEYDAKVLCADFELGKLFEEIAKLGAEPKTTAKIITRELLAVLNHDSLQLSEIKVSPKDLFELVKLISDGKVSDKNVKSAMINYISGDKTTPKQFLEKNNLLISTSINADEIISKIIASNQKAVEDYKAGNEKSLNFLAGLVMRETKGTLDPKKVQELLKKQL
jgi:aspartyl-tRNA(Asn)/glutamyl-tRNA(Gln) amidotransferase subunit B